MEQEETKEKQQEEEEEQLKSWHCVVCTLENEPLEVLEGPAGTQQGQRRMEIGRVDKKGSKVFCHLLFHRHLGHLPVQHGHLLGQRDGLHGRHDDSHPSSCFFASTDHGKSDAEV